MKLVENRLPAVSWSALSAAARLVEAADSLEELEPATRDEAERDSEHFDGKTTEK